MSFKIHTLAAMTGLAVTATLVAQTSQTPTSTQSPTSASQRPDVGQTQTRVALEDLMNADVVLTMSGADMRSDDAMDTDKNDKNTKGADVKTEKKGKVKDLVLTARDGNVSSAVVSVGGMLGIGDKVVLVPASSLNFKMVDNKPCYELRMSESQLKASSDFDVDKATKEGVDQWVDKSRSTTAASSTTGTAGTTGTTGTAGTAMPADMKSPPRHILASQIKGARVEASDKEFGKVTNASVDTNRNAVDYLLVSQGGALGMGDTIHLVPYQGLTWTRMDDKNVLKANKTIGELKNAPQYKKPDKGFLTPEQAKQADDFCGIKRVSYD